MDLLEIIEQELKSKHLTDLEKARYIYLRTCELFSFDGRYYFQEFINDSEFQDMLRRIDITNVSNFLVICHNYSQDVLARLIREFTAATVSVHQSVHSYVLYEESPCHIWTLDATYGDFPRIKLGMIPSGFQGLRKGDNQRIIDIDNILGYTYKSKKDYLKMLDLSSIKNLYASINRILINSKCNKEYSDALYLIKWLLLSVMYPFNETNGIDSNNRFYHFFEADSSLFCLKDDDGFNISELSEEDALSLTRELNISIDNIPRIRNQ